jgi:uncharacterized small protein (DUF1192 family)
LQLIEAQRFALAAPSAPELLQRIRALEAELARLRAQLEAGSDTLRHVNAARRAAATHLREAIAQAVAREAHPEAVSAKLIMKALARAGWTDLPSVRTVQRHLDAVRHSARVARGT